MTQQLLEQLAGRMAAVSPAWERIAHAPAHAVSFVDETRLASGVAAGVEAIREGWLLHRGVSRIAPDASADLALLLGDWCYAAGLCDVTEHGTLTDVRILADLIADVAARADEPIDALESRWDAAVAALATATL